MVDEPLRKGEQTQAHILDAAFALCVAQGYHGTSRRQIVERAGITVGGVYNHFASKEDIWRQFFERNPYDAILPVLCAAEGATADNYIRDTARRLIGELRKQQELPHLMLIELVECNGAHIPQLAAVVSEKAGPLRTIPLPLLVRSFLGYFFRSTSLKR